MAKIKIVGQESLQELKQIITELNTLKEAMTGVGGSVKNFRKMDTALKSMQGLPTKLSNAWIQYDKNLKNVTKSQRSYKTQTENLKKTLAGLNAELKIAQTRLAGLQSKASKGGFFSGVLGSAKQLIAAFGVIQGFQLFADLTRKAFNLTTTLDSMNFAMKAVITDVEELAQTQGFLKQITNDYGAELVTTTNRYIKFRAAAEAANLTSVETQKIFKTMTKAAGVLGLKTDELQGIYLALEQMISKGKITTEELRRQLGERLPGAMDIMADSMGVTTAQLDEMLKKGEVITKDVLPAFADQVQIAFGLDSIGKVETLQAAIVRFQNSFTIMVEDFNTASGAGKRLADVINFLAENMQTLVSIFINAVSVLAAYKASMLLINGIKLTSAKISKILSAKYWEEFAAKTATTKATLKETIANKANTASKVTLGKVTTALTARLRVMYATMMANPVGLFAAAVALLVTAVWGLREAFKDNYDELQKLNKEQADAIVKQRELEETNRALTSRYEELNEKMGENREITRLNAEEQSELNDVIIAIGENIPSAIQSVDEYGRALSLNSDEIRRYIQLQNEKSALEAEATLSVATEQLIIATHRVDDLSNAQKGLSKAWVDGVGEVEKVGDRMVKIVGGMYKELTNDDKLALNDWEQNWKSRQKIAEASVKKMQKTLKDFNEDPTGEKRAALAKQLAEEERLREAALGKLDKQTINYIDGQIKHFEDLIKGVTTDALSKDTDDSFQIGKNREKIKAFQDEIAKLQEHKNKLLGVEEKGHSKSLRKLREIRDLQHEINLILLKRRSTELELRINNENLDYDIRKQALEQWVENEEQLLKEASDNEVGIATAKAQKLIDLNNKEISAGTSPERKKDLEDNTAAIQKELTQKIEKIEQEHTSNLIDLQTERGEIRAGILEEQNEFTLGQIQRGFDEQIIAAQEFYAADVNLYKGKVAAADEEFEKSEKRNKDIRKRDKAYLAAKEELAKSEIALNNKVAEITFESLNAVTDAKIKSLNDFIDGLDNSAGLFDDIIKKIKASIAELEKNRPKFTAGEDDVEDAKITFQEILDLTAEFNDAIARLVDATFERKIEFINAEIVAEERKYDRLIELASNDAEQKKTLERNKEEAIQKLERKRLKEQQKQAKARKAFAVADIAISAAQGIMNVWAEWAAVPIVAGILTGALVALAGVQTAAVLSEPIPQYKDGLTNAAKDHIAMINDGGQQEFVERGGKILTTKKRNAIVPIEKGDTVYKGYNDMISKSAIFRTENRRLNNNFKLESLKDALVSSIDKGFRGAKIQNRNNINIATPKSNEEYKAKLNRWSK